VLYNITDTNLLNGLFPIVQLLYKLEAKFTPATPISYQGMVSLHIGTISCCTLKEG